MITRKSSESGFGLNIKPVKPLRRKYFWLFTLFSFLAISSVANAAQEVFVGEITSASPSSFTAGQSATVTVRIRSTSGSGNVIIEADSWTSGWSVSPKNRNPTINQGTYYDQIFTVTPPTAGGSGTIVWKLYDDDYGVHPSGSKLLATRNQSVSAAVVTSLSFRNSSGSVISQIEAGQTVYLRADATGMNGQTIQIELWEDDGIGDDKIITPSITINSSGYGTYAWSSVWQQNDGDTPINSYYLYYSLTSLYSGEKDTGHFLVKDTTPPAIPTSYTSDPSANVWTNDNTVYVSWSGANDGASGIDGYSLLWNNSSSTIPDTTKDTSSTSTTSSALSDGIWYLHVRVVDKVGNWSSGALHCGPFKIDRTNPGLPTIVSPPNNSTVMTIRPTLSWSAASDGSGSGVTKYHLKVFQNWGVYWDIVDKDVTGTSYTLNESEALQWGQNYGWRIYAIDAVGNSGDYTGNRYFTVQDPNPTISRVSPSSPITIAFGTNQGFTVQCEDVGGDLWKVEWVLTGPKSESDIDDIGFDGSSDTADFTDWGGYTFDKDGDYTLTATVYDNSGDNALVSWSIHVNPQPKPDLVISDIKMNDLTTLPSVKPGDTVSLDFYGNNITLGTTSKSMIQMKAWWGTSQNSMTNPICTEYFGEINGLDYNENEETTYSWMIPQLAPGTYWITVKIDTDNKQNDEPDENNNIRSKSFTVVQPDLTITSVWTEPASPVTGQNYMVKATVYNQGNAPANPSGLDQWINCRFYIGSTDLEQETQWCTSIPAKGTYTFSSNSKTAPAAGNYTIKAVADSQGDVAESSETNNEKTASITVQTPPKSDLIIDSIWTNPTIPQQGQSFEVWARIKNVGNGDAGGFYTSCYVDGQYKDEIYLSSLIATIGLADKKIATISNASGGSHTLLVKADLSPTSGHNNLVGESNEGNNTKSVGVVVNRPPSQPGRLWVEQVTNNSAKIHWGEANDPDGDKSITYKFETKEDRWLDWRGPWTTQPTSTTIWELNSNTTYDFHVCATDGKGGESAWQEVNDGLFTTRKYAVTDTNLKGEFEYSPEYGETTDSNTELGNRIPVILVHGANGDQKPNSLNYWYWWIRDYFNDDRYAGMFKVYRYVYDSSKHIADNGTAFANFVNSYPELQNRRVLIMAHSMGGLVARYALNTDPCLLDKTIKLLTLGTPHLGSPGANPCWIYAVDGSPGSTFILWVYKLAFDGISPGDYDLAWYNPSETLPNSKNYFNEVLRDFHCDDRLLDNSMKTPFTNITQMTSNNSDSKIIAFGGYLGNLPIFGEIANLPPESNIIDEVTKYGLNDHGSLMLAKGAMAKINKKNGNYFLQNDGLVPLESAKFATHNKIESIDITDSIDKKLDHSSYLDYQPVMDYIKGYILDYATIPTPITPADDATVDTLTPTFVWSEFPDTGGGPTQVGYQLRVWCDNCQGISKPVYDTEFVADTSSHSHTMTKELEHFRKYHWHVRYRYDDNGEQRWSRWSADSSDPPQDFYTPTIGTFSITPGTGLSSFGYAGGPFTPTDKIYTLTNTGGMAITVAISVNQSWLSVSQTSVPLSPGQSTPVAVSINSSANSLDAGSYASTVSFVNLTNHGGDTSRKVNLLVSPYIVPNVAGKTAVDANMAIINANLVVGTVTTAYSNTVAAGKVISQNPAGGTKVNIDSTVTYKVSLGKPVVPDVVGKTVADANTAIKSANLKVGTVTTAYSDTVAAGKVISQSPAKDTKVLIGSAVNYVKSLGSKPVVPNVVGKTVADANTAIKSANLKVGTVTTAYSDTVAAGKVIRQSPAAGTKVLIGSAVNYVKSLGFNPVGTWTGTWSNDGLSGSLTLNLKSDKTLSGTFRQPLADYGLLGTATIPFTGTYVFNSKTNALTVECNGQTTVQGFPIKASINATGQTTAYNKANGDYWITTHIYYNENWWLCDDNDHGTWTMKK